MPLFCPSILNGKYISNTCATFHNIEIKSFVLFDKMQVNCDFCPFKAQNSQILRLHNYKHNFCVPCKELCLDLQDFIKHLEDVHRIKHECSVCQKRFLLELTLKKHIQSHSKDEIVEVSCHDKESKKRLHADVSGNTMY